MNAPLDHVPEDDYRYRPAVMRAGWFIGSAIVGLVLGFFIGSLT